MKLEHAQAIENAADAVGLDVELYEKYSGRGMYGEETSGVVGSLGDIICAIAYAANQMGYDRGYLGEEYNDDESFLEWTKHIRFDSMGRSNNIVY